ncbi:MAG: Rrf2 family transcriptional regulator [Clostridiales Family XIII bacterium]|jgi:Rrf2 family protein|nr:Rrf2 family transcriptional regulator [Clostridiales Family XIII bacterium]
MRISVKGRYALAAAVLMAEKTANGGNLTVACISSELGISKIYLEQVFTQLKKLGIVTSTKGPKGGYQLAKHPATITAWNILSALETTLTEETEETVSEKAPEMEIVLDELVFAPLDKAVREQLNSVTLCQLCGFEQQQKVDQSFMMGL